MRRGGTLALSACKYRNRPGQEAVDTSVSGSPCPYAGAEYVATLGHVGRCVRLPGSGLHVIEREVPATERRDVTGPYPLLPVPEPRALGSDLAAGRDSDGRPWLSFVAVTEPLSSSSGEALSEAFPDVARPFKRHFVVDASLPEHLRTSAHHRRELRRARRFAHFDVVGATQVADDWVRLYAELVASLGLSGPSAFPAESLRAQLALDGALTVRAVENDATTAVAVVLWEDEHGWYHLAAQDRRGRAHGAGYGALATALLALAERGVRMVDLGAAAGLEEDAEDGLARFKAGFATGRAEAWLIGAVLDRDAYAALAGEHARRDFFPAYRASAPEAGPGDEGS